MHLKRDQNSSEEDKSKLPTITQIQCQAYKNCVVRSQKKNTENEKLESRQKKIKSMLNVRGSMHMVIDFSSEAIKERQGNYLFKKLCALKLKKEKKNQSTRNLVS